MFLILLILEGPTTFDGVPGRFLSTFDIDVDLWRAAMVRPW